MGRTAPCRPPSAGFRHFRRPAVRNEAFVFHGRTISGRGLIGLVNRLPCALSGDGVPRSARTAAPVIFSPPPLPVGPTLPEAPPPLPCRRAPPCRGRLSALGTCRGGASLRVAPGGPRRAVRGSPSFGNRRLLNSKFLVNKFFHTEKITAVKNHAPFRGGSRPDRGQKSPAGAGPGAFFRNGRKKGSAVCRTGRTAPLFFGGVMPFRLKKTRFQERQGLRGDESGKNAGNIGRQARIVANVGFRCGINVHSLSEVGQGKVFFLARKVGVSQITIP